MTKIVVQSVSFSRHTLMRPSRNLSVQSTQDLFDFPSFHLFSLTLTSFERRKKSSHSLHFRSEDTANLHTYFHRLIQLLPACLLQIAYPNNFYFLIKASKAAVIGLYDTMRAELSPDIKGIHKGGEIVVDKELRNVTVGPNPVGYVRVHEGDCGWCLQGEEICNMAIMVQGFVFDQVSCP